MANNPHLSEDSKGTQWKPGQTGNPAGKPKGTKHISTWIQDLANDEEFEANILDAKKGYIEYKGAPLKAIISVAITKAVNGDEKAREWLAKYGWKAQLDITTNDESLRGEVDPTVAAAFAEFLRNK